MPSTTLEKKPILIVSALMVAGLALRWIMLAKESLWLDELVSWICASRSFWPDFYCDINKPPLYYPLLHAWMSIFGTTEVALRALSIPPGVVSIWLVYLLARKLFSRPIAYLAAGYQTISTFQIYYAQEARNYTWLVFFLLLAGIFLWEALESTARRRRLGYFAAYTLAISLALYTHYFAAFFIAGHGLYVLFRRPRQLLPASASVAIAIASILPWLIIMVKSPGATEAQTRKYLLLKFPQAYFSFMFGDSLVPLDAQAVQHVRQTLAASGWILVLALGSLAVLLPFLWQAWKRWREPFLFTLVHATLPLFLAFFVSFKKMLFDERYMIPSSPYVYILLAAGAWEVVMLSRKKGEARWKAYAGSGAIAAYVLLLVVSLYNYYFVPRFGKEQWRDVVSYIESNSAPDKSTLIAFDPGYMDRGYWYYQKRGLPIWPLEDEGLQPLKSGDLLRERVRGVRKLWLVRSHYLSDDALNAFRKAFPQASYRVFPNSNGIEVFQFDIPETHS